MLDPFIVRALAAGIGVALIAGPLGCFVVWRRMAYFGDSLAHSALLGIALGMVTGINPTLGTILVSTGFAMMLLWLQHTRILATDTLLGILAHATEHNAQAAERQGHVGMVRSQSLFTNGQGLFMCGHGLGMVAYAIEHPAQAVEKVGP